MNVIFGLFNGVENCLKGIEAVVQHLNPVEYSDQGFAAIQQQPHDVHLLMKLFIFEQGALRQTNKGVLDKDTHLFQVRNPFSGKYLFFPVIFTKEKIEDDAYHRKDKEYQEP
jgi:hypothetical protein